ncbi:MAG: hypothetical protein A2231_03150 [Candidatus Firestonebacteria bacterium RIFOXYA2_FULL_40_8]|nr:MAG: hypothetical protein A2231_03150 [Candidatus Firestonebacteria bacterium RIFOXYA2_FULL_40_8]
MLKNDNYRQFIEDNFKIVNKQGVLVDFILNAIQRKYLLEDYTGTDDILKARQEGFSSLINAIFTADFLLKEHSYSVIVADIEENATGLLDRVKMFLSSYEEKNKIKIPLKYDSRFEMYNNFMDSRFVIGTAKNAEFGRSKTITNLHCSELAFFSNIEKITAGAGQAVVDGGRKIYETTANGYNSYKKFRDEDNGFNKIFYSASQFYPVEFLAKKKKELGRLFRQEYPESEAEAFITSGDPYFKTESLEYYLSETKNVEAI